MTVPADIEVIDADNARRAVHAPLAPGRAIAAESRPVALSTEDKTALDALLAKLSADPATQTTLAAIAALLTTQAGYLDGIEGLIGTTNAKDFATQTTLAAVLAKLTAGATTIAKVEDVASADADVGIPAMMVRKATPANTSGTDGDYEMLQGSAGRLWVDASGVSLTVAPHAVTNAGTFAVQATVAAGAATIGKAEDAASADADVGVPAMAVRKATPANTSGTDGDYEMLQMAAGRLWTRAIVTDANDAAFLSAANALNATGAGILAAQIVAQFDDTSPTSITENQFGNVRMSANRNIYGTIRDAAGNERGANVDSLNRLSTSIDNIAAGSNLIGRAVADASAATGGIASTARLPSATNSTNATNVKTSAGRIYSVCGKNNAAYDVFLVLYDAATNPPVPGTTTIRKKVPCPAGQAFVYDFPVGLSCANGIGYAFTKLVADADMTVLAAADITAFNLDYV